MDKTCISGIYIIIAQAHKVRLQKTVEMNIQSQRTMLLKLTKTRIQRRIIFSSQTNSLKLKNCDNLLVLMNFKNML